MAVFVDGTILNSGTIGVTGANAVGATFFLNGAITNTGTISATGLNSIVILSPGTLNLNNSGQITVSGNFGTAIVAGDNSVLVNSGTISISGSGSQGIAGNDNVSITNTGTISNTDGNNPSIELNDNGILNNSGTIVSIGGSAPVVVARDGNRLTNTGTITARGPGAIAVLTRDNNTITNSGTVNLSDDAFAGIQVDGSNNTVINNGLITGGGFFTAGIQANAGGTGNVITNNGTISMGQGTVGLDIDDDGAIVTNNGTITVGDGGFAVDFCGCVTGFTFNNNGLLRAPGTGFAFNSGGAGVMIVNNNGTMDGPVFADGVLFNNRGKVMLSDAATAAGAQIVTVSSGGTFTNFSTGVISLRANTAGAADTVNVDNLVLNAPGGGGTLQIAPQAGIYGATTNYTGVVTTNTSMAGTFNSVASTSPFLRASAVYNANSIDVTLIRVGFGSVPNLDGNQKAVGQALQAGFNAPNLSPQAQALYATLFTATSTDILNQLSGQGASGTQSSAFGAANLFQSALADQSAAWRTSGGFAGTGTVLVAANQMAQSTMTDAGPAQLFLAPDTPIRVWTMGFGNYQSLAGDSTTGATGTNVQTGGAAVGIERQFAPDFLVGFALGGSGSGFSSPNANTNGSLTGVQAGVYATKSLGPYYLTGSLSFGYFDNSTTRSITDLTTPETATGSYASYQFSGRMEAGRRFTVGAFEQDYGVTPFAALEGSNLWQSGYTESSVNAAGGAGIAALTYQAQQVGSLPTTLGVQFDTQIKSEDGKIWAPYLRLGWQHEFMTTRNINAALTAIPDNDFTAQGAPATSDTAMIDLGLKVLYSKNLSMFINANSQMAGSFLSYGGKAGFMWSF